jgi:hypothetical protein
MVVTIWIIAEPMRRAFEESMRRLHSAAENGKTLIDKYAC